MKKRLILALFILVAVAMMVLLSSCGHDCDYSVEVTESGTPATCLKSGVKVMKCSECENTKNEILPALGHDYVSNVIAPTCNKEGYTTQACSRCGDTNGDAKLDRKQPTGQHQYVLVENSKVEATCTQNGYEIQKCSGCGHEKTANQVTAPGHSYKEIQIFNVVPTCTTGGAGVTTKRCEVCDEKDPSFVDKAENYDPLGHDLQHTDAYRTNSIAKTCTTAQRDTWDCKRDGCDYSETEDVGTPLGHSRTVDVGVSVPATCCSLEYRTFECERKGQPGCVGTSLQGPVSMDIPQEGTFTAHTMGPAATCVDAQVCTVCQSAGRTTLGTNCDNDNPNCTKCSDYQMIHVFANPTGLHDYIDYSDNSFKVSQAGETVAPTCMRQGYTVYSCTVCGGDDFKDNYTDINPIAHNVDYENAIGNPVLQTCTMHEYTVHGCINTADDGSACDYTENKVYGTTFADHTFTTGEPTGVITCSSCQQSFYDTTYVESTYKEYVAVEAGTGTHKKVEEYVAVEAGETGEYILDGTDYRLVTEGETGTHKLVVSYEEATGEGADYVLKTWDGSTGTDFGDDASLNVTITVSKSNAEPLKLDSTKTSDDSIVDSTGITVIRIISSDDTTKYKVTVNGTQTYELTGSGYVDLHDYLDGADSKDPSDDVEISSLKVEIVEGTGEATVYFYGKEAVPAE